MADTVATQVLLNGPRNIMVLMANSSDGTGETLVKKVDASSAGPFGVLVAGQTFYPGVHMKISRLEYDIRGSGGVNLYWDATAPQLFMALSGAGTLSLDEPYQVINAMTTGATGSILLSTVSFAAGSGYTITMHLTKNVPQS
jgi:hypothetical protein